MFPKDPNSPMWVMLTDFRAQCRYYLYTWIPRGCIRIIFPYSLLAANIVGDFVAGIGHKSAQRATSRA